MDWTIIISSIGGSAVLFGALAFLARSIIVHFLDKDVENFKNTLQLKAIEHQVRFNSLHAKRAEIIAEFYQKMLQLHIVLCGIRERKEKTFEDKDRDLGLGMMKACTEAMQFFKMNELYFDEDLCVKIEKLNSKVFGEAKIFAAMAMLWKETVNTPQFEKIPDIKQQLENKLSETSRVLNSEIPSLLDELKKRFRDILGVPQIA